MTAALVDIGINLTDSAFTPDCLDVINAARDAGVRQLIITGTDVENSQAALHLCRQFGPGLTCTAGVHPHYAKHWNEQHAEQIRTLAQQPEVVAIGETGLDYNRNLSAPEIQRTVFRAQLEIAVETGLPLFLHERDALQDQVILLEQYRSRIAGGVAHCFTGTEAALKQYLSLDLYIGITGWICDERRGTHLRELVRQIPLNRLLLETDGPYLLPRDLNPKPRSRRNEPRYLPHIAQTVADCLGILQSELIALTTANARRLFQLPALEPG